MPLVRRMGASPPVGPTIAWFTLAGVISLVAGDFVMTLTLPRVTAAAASMPELVPFVESMAYLPAALLCLVALDLAWRSMAVRAWRAELSDERARTEAAERGRQLAESQLAMMQAQIEPHFLYNTLASVQYLVRKDGAAADFLLTQLIRYLRHAMPKLREPMSHLGQEFELADAFLQIARMRMGGRLSVSVELAEHLHDIPFPPLVLQTLVENALKHGVEPKVGEVWVNVSAERTGDQLRLTVSDNGVGIGSGPAATAGSGTGLKNIRERLAGIYGETAVLSVSGLPEGGVAATVQLVIPQARKSADFSPSDELGKPQES